MTNSDTIAAFCTAPGGALAIIRISGPAALAAANSVWTPAKHPLSKESPRVLAFGHVLRDDGSHGETCLASYMPSPASYTGEDVVEIQCHGGSIAPKKIMSSLLRAGVRPAEPGEFTRRAFVNGKLDLAQAEAVCDLVSAKTESAFALASKQLSGALGSAVRGFSAELRHLLAEVESRLDFPEENLDFMPASELISALSKIRSGVEKLLSAKTPSEIIRNGIRLVIAGNPNAGKSSLMNLLLGYDRAIVSDIPGTTRDTLRESVSIRGVAVEITDTAGIRDASSDVIENLGMTRSRDTIRQAELVFWLFDSSSFTQSDIERMKLNVPERSNAVAVWNKIDLAPEGFIPPVLPFDSAVVSVLKKTGMETLLDIFEKKVWGGGGRTEVECAVSARHAGALEDASASLYEASAEVEKENYELVAANIRNAIASIARITGESASADVLDEIFSRFCIGK